MSRRIKRWTNQEKRIQNKKKRNKCLVVTTLQGLFQPMMTTHMAVSSFQYKFLQSLSSSVGLKDTTQLDTLINSMRISIAIGCDFNNFFFWWVDFNNYTKREKVKTFYYYYYYYFPSE